VTLAAQIHALATRPGVFPEAQHLLQLAAQAAAGTAPSLTTIPPHIAMPTPATTNPWNPPHAPPDDETTVLLRLADTAEPIWPGFYLEGVWRDPGGAQISDPVTGWMHFEDAARILDSATH
jgi:hypothetical protein